MSQEQTGMPLLRTPLYELHLELGARMVPFAGYEMPVQYPTGIKAEHEQTRRAAGLFDISHMGQVRLTGSRADHWLEGLVPGEIAGLGVNRQRYSVLTNEQGGIIDDLMITRMQDHYFLVVNASRKAVDMAWFEAQREKDIALELVEDRALLAIQGPAAAAILADHEPALATLPFMSAHECRLDGIEVLVHRCGYTGEDGYEISVAADAAVTLARRLLSNPLLAPIGLGARDSLRLEAGLCLYGHELDETTSPVEAELGWVIARKYRNGETGARFPGSARILGELAGGTSRRRCGLRPEGRIPVRDGTIILDSRGAKAGIITSGGFGPSVGGPVAMGYVETGVLGQGDSLHVEIRNQTHPLQHTALPFVHHRYYKQTA